MNLFEFICVIVAIIVIGAQVGKPLGWLGMGFAVLALVIRLLGLGGR
jgi:hypothetical protein